MVMTEVSLLVGAVDDTTIRFPPTRSESSALSTCPLLLVSYVLLNMSPGVKVPVIDRPEASCAVSPARSEVGVTVSPVKSMRVSPS